MVINSNTTRKLAAIALLLVFLFNVGGYYIVFWVLNSSINERLSAKIDEDAYFAEETITFEIPFSLPYPIYQNGYNKVDGDLEYGGVYYKRIKQKIENDTLFVVCLKNRSKAKLMSAMDDITRLMATTPLKTNGLLNLMTKIINSYQYPQNINCVIPSGETIVLNAYYQDPFYQDIEVLIISPPPEFIS